ncbi:hypothetical protein [Aurantiacibacter atlanticus]|uniref:hypothetical protein n=1 Tax=Aurantiacibacter atlanticus TaxID=1648404 RepID=UPI00065F50E6|nr:hypothetical protein [Aurantiacibacter atlanticus]
MLIVAKQDGRIQSLPLKFGDKIATDGDRWLEGLVARSCGYSNAKFKGAFAEEFSHLADKGLRFIDFDAHIEAVRKHDADAISHTRYGYDSDKNENDGWLAKDDDDDDDYAF